MYVTEDERECLEYARRQVMKDVANGDMSPANFVKAVDIIGDAFDLIDDVLTNGYTMKGARDLQDLLRKIMLLGLQLRQEQKDKDL